MNIHLVLDPTAQAAPQAVKDAWNQAANMLDLAITDLITVNIKVTWGVKDGSTGNSFGTPDNGQKVSYQSFHDALTANASGGDSTFAFLPSGGTVQGSSQVGLFNAQLKLFGALNPLDTSTDDGSVDFGTGTPTNDMVGAALHEFSHVLGRFPIAGTDPSVFDLSRFSNEGTRSFENSIPADRAYFSLNNGFSEWADYGQNSDPADFLNNPMTSGDAFNEFIDASFKQYMTPLDLEQLDALGYHLKFNAPAVDNSDFNGDNSGDILLQNSSGEIDYINMADGNFNGWTNVANTPGWFVVGQGKISGGTSSDVVIADANRNIWYANLHNGTFSNWVNYNAQTPGFTVVGVGDINCDHLCDLVIQNGSGQIDYAMTSASGQSRGALDHYVSVANTPGWRVVGVGDVNFDGYADIVIQNPTTGDIDYANMNGGNFSGWQYVSTVAGWNVVGVGDIDRNGNADIVIQNGSSGAIDYAQMNHDGTFGQWAAVGTAPGWNVIGVEDILATGFDDIVIENSSNGQIDYADMTTGRFNSWVSVTSAPGFFPVANSPASSMDSIGMSDPHSQGGAVAAVTMSDPGIQGGSMGAITMSDPGPTQKGVSGLTMYDPGALDGTIIPLSMFDPAPQGGAVGPVTMSDPGPHAPLLGPATMFDPNPQASRV